MPRAFAPKFGLPMQARIADGLVDLLLTSDEVLGILHREAATGFDWIEPLIQRIYDDVNDVMLRITD